MSFWTPTVHNVHLDVDGTEVEFVVHKYDGAIEIPDAFTTEIIITPEGKQAMRRKPWLGDLTYDLIERIEVACYD